jgi:hypothetical protein
LAWVLLGAGLVALWLGLKVGWLVIATLVER